MHLQCARNAYPPVRRLFFRAKSRSRLENMAGNGASWKKFKDKMKERRMGKSKDKKKDGKSALNDYSITVQRLSAEVSGKAQKYGRIAALVYLCLLNLTTSQLTILK